MSWFHKHRYEEKYGGLYADEPGGPKTVHEIWWECSCGKIHGEAAKLRAMRAAASLSERVTP